MATYIVDSTGSSDAELIGDFVTDDVAHTVTFNSGTAGEARPLKALETTRQWLVIEVIEVGGIVGVIGKHVYSEDVTDIQTRVEAIRQEMIALHSSFIINCTHYLTESVVNVYRGDEATVVALSAGDTNITFTSPSVWVIDDLNTFAPTTPVVSVNMVVDPGCDNPADWSSLDASAAITGSKLEVTNSSGSGKRVYPHLNGTLESGASYKVGCTVDSMNGIAYRFYLGATASAFRDADGVVSDTIIFAGDDQTMSIQCLDGSILTADDFICERL